MQTYIISYDMAWGGDYDALHEAIQNYGAWAHITESTWAVLTEYSAEVLRDDLSEYLPDGSHTVTRCNPSQQVALNFAT